MDVTKIPSVEAFSSLNENRDGVGGGLARVWVQSRWIDDFSELILECRTLLYAINQKVDDGWSGYKVVSTKYDLKESLD